MGELCCWRARILYPGVAGRRDSLRAQRHHAAARSCGQNVTRSWGRRSPVVDPCRDRPHPHWLGWEWANQVTRIGLVAQPPGVVGRREYQRHTVVNLSDQFVRLRRELTADVRTHSPEAGPFRFSHRPPIPERAAVLHGDGIGLLRLLAFNRLPLEELVNRQDAPALTISLSERRERPDGLAFGIDRLAPTFRVLAPIWDETPADWIERDFADLVVAPDHQQAPGLGAAFHRGG